MSLARQSWLPAAKGSVAGHKMHGKWDLHKQCCSITFLFLPLHPLGKGKKRGDKKWLPHEFLQVLLQQWAFIHWRHHCSNDITTSSCVKSRCGGTDKREQESRWRHLSFLSLSNVNYTLANGRLMTLFWLVYTHHITQRAEKLSDQSPCCRGGAHLPPTTHIHTKHRAWFQRKQDVNISHRDVCDTVCFNPLCGCFLFWRAAQQLFFIIKNPEC